MLALLASVTGEAWRVSVPASVPPSRQMAGDAAHGATFAQVRQRPPQTQGSSERVARVAEFRQGIGSQSVSVRDPHWELAGFPYRSNHHVVHQSVRRTGYSSVSRIPSPTVPSLRVWTNSPVPTAPCAGSWFGRFHLLWHDSQSGRSTPPFDRSQSGPEITWLLQVVAALRRPTGHGQGGVREGPTCSARG